MTYYIISLGCSKNLVDSEKINGRMSLAGFQLAEISDEADILIINTCGFINPAKEESIEVILDAVQHRESGKRIVVMGCLAERYYEEIKKDIPEIDFIYGLPDENFITRLGSELNIHIDDNNDTITQKPLIPSMPYSYIKISEGCSNNCSYCAIPLIRGPKKSCSVNSIINDSETAVQHGVKELIIIAQDIASYSWHKGEDSEVYLLPDLVNRISAISEVEWIRLMYCHPDHINEDIINLIRDNNKVVRYIDIPFQHASRKILHSMGRKGDSNEYTELIMTLRNKVPGIRIRSTFMVGYPGETEKDFQILMDFINKTRLDRVGAFVYSPEEGTRASDLEDQVPEEIKNKRYDKLMKTQSIISMKKLDEMIDEEVDLIIEEQVDENTYIGRTEFDAPEVDGVFYLTAGNVELNSIVTARVTGSTEYDLIGEIV